MKLIQITEVKYAFSKTAAEVHQIYRKIARDYKYDVNLTLAGVSPPHRVDMTRYQSRYPDQTKPYINTNISFLVYDTLIGDKIIKDKKTAIRKVKEIIDGYDAPYYSINGFKQPSYWHITVAFRE